VSYSRKASAPPTILLLVAFSKISASGFCPASRATANLYEGDVVTHTKESDKQGI